MSDEVEPTFLRDEELEQRMLAAVIADRNSQPRNQQILVGPSSIGFCRELLRAQLFEAQSTNVAQEENWALAAHVGTVMGEDLERIFGERLDAITQQRVTALFTSLGIHISGAMDLVFVDGDHVSDLKSTTDIGGILYDLQKNAKIIDTLLGLFREGTLFNKGIETPDGGYELTDRLLRGFSKLHYYVQIAIYVTGAIQSGVLSPNAEGRLVFYDRAGEYQEFVALRITPDLIALFFEIGQRRVSQVARAQELFEQTGNVYVIHELRDQVPSFCYSPKVMCPLRDRCWGGSRWDAEDPLEGAELSSSMDRYIEGRRLAKLGEGMKQAAKAELKGIEGRFADGRMITWPGGRINVVETAKGAAAASERKAAKAALEAADAAARKAELELQAATPAEGSSSAVAAESTPDLMGALRESIEQKREAIRDAASERDPRIDSVVFRDSETGQISDTVPPEVAGSVQRLRKLQESVAAERAARKIGEEGYCSTPGCTLGYNHYGRCNVADPNAGA